MIPALHTLQIYEGDTLATWFAITEEDGTVVTLNGFTGEAEVRQVSDDTLILTAAVVVVPATGRFCITATPAVTAALTPSEDSLRWDCKLTNGVVVNTVVHGPAVILPEVTAS